MGVCQAATLTCPTLPGHQLRSDQGGLRASGLLSCPIWCALLIYTLLIKEAVVHGNVRWVNILRTFQSFHGLWMIILYDAGSPADGLI